MRCNAGGGLCLCAFTVGKQWCDARTDTDACLPGRAIDRESMVPRWRLAREGPFLEEERSAESIRSLGPGCAFRNTTYRVSDYAEPEVETGTLGPRVYRAAKQMESMGLWRPSTDPLRLH